MSKAKIVKLIPCPSCGNEDENPDHDGFSFPWNVSDEREYIVCQNCGRRTLAGDWNNIDAKVFDELPDDL
ncbi:hypothetical protein [Photobacterium kishitanii]|uniref:Uncharacterized protein n=1 Tax=Photobacterium kishitanii TaxID=318456 RepID=A0A2T3KL09_9GAMM|nr:hypothetical protein [Photobacterium kishitanii]PSV00404.1 hypothetical protein C9J27_04550 [Photobacterium kishitanii]